MQVSITCLLAFWDQRCHMLAFRASDFVALGGKPTSISVSLLFITEIILSFTGETLLQVETTYSATEAM